MSKLDVLKVVELYHSRGKAGAPAGIVNLFVLACYYFDYSIPKWLGVPLLIITILSLFASYKEKTEFEKALDKLL